MGGAVGLNVQQAIAVGKSIGANQCSAGNGIVESDLECIRWTIALLQPIDHGEFNITILAGDVESLRKLGIGTGAVFECGGACSVGGDITGGSPVCRSAGEIVVGEG